MSEVMPLRDHVVAGVTFEPTKGALQATLPSTMVPSLSFLCWRKARQRGHNRERETNQRGIDFLIPMNFFPLLRALLWPLTHECCPLRDICLKSSGFLLKHKCGKRATAGREKSTLVSKEDT